MKRIFLLIFIALILQGCLKDDVNIPVNISIENNIELLRYLEEQGDYINSPAAPSLIDPSEVYVNRTSYMIIDVRTNEEFINGHIEGAENVNSTDLLNFALSRNLQSYQKAVLVSSDGQASAYYTCLLRLYGFNNVYSMNFGMAYWNSDFARVWLQKTKNSPNLNLYDSINYPKNRFEDLPSYLEEGEGEIAGQRIAFIIARGFIDWVDDIDETQTGRTSYLICYGSSVLYGKGHPPNTVFYLEANSLESANDLQTLPTDKEIIIYDYNGQLSAAVTAYLQVLGYNAKSFLFGANQLIYGSMTGSLDRRLFPYAFLPGNINNYPYITGE